MPRRRTSGQKAPATPAPGSSPISPPGGSGRRPRWPPLFGGKEPPRRRLEPEKETIPRGPEWRGSKPPGLAAYLAQRQQVMQARQVQAGRAPRRGLPPPGGGGAQG